MRKVFGLAALIAALAVPATVVAADLQNAKGTTSCDGIATWHFVNNQTGGAGAGMIEVEFSTGTVTAGATTVLRNTQHFFVQTTGVATLLDAHTSLPNGDDLPGNLVLSGPVTCEGGKGGGKGDGK